jgi:hypothetical protein
LLELEIPHVVPPAEVRIVLCGQNNNLGAAVLRPLEAGRRIGLRFNSDPARAALETDSVRPDVFLETTGIIGEGRNCIGQAFEAEKKIIADILFPVPFWLHP